jgi:hypothetical protein
MKLAMLRRLAKATFIQGQRSFVIHNGVGDLPRADDDASFGQVPVSGTKPPPEEVASTAPPAPARPLRKAAQ